MPIGNIPNQIQFLVFSTTSLVSHASLIAAMAALRPLAGAREWQWEEVVDRAFSYNVRLAKI